MPILIRSSKEALVEILNTLKRQNELHSGKTWGWQPLLTVGQPAMELYFGVKYVESIKLPKGQTTLIPRHPFRRMILLNEGNADMMWDTNRKPADQQQTSLLRANEDIQIDATGQEPLFSFSAIAIPPGGPSPSINAGNWNGDVTTVHLRLVCIT
jgi:hypothetical protein